jgi:3-keto steroid reductase
MTAAFYLARWLGSPWHPISSYSGACAPVWLGLADQSTLDALEGHAEGAKEAATSWKKGKWGSATDFWGEARVRRTEVGGWGWSGSPEEPGKAGYETRTGRLTGAQDLTKESREDFESLGRQCWAAMEALRLQWEAILGVRK